MAKKPTISNSDIAALIEHFDQHFQLMVDVPDAVSKMSIAIDKPLEFAREFALIAKAASAASLAMMVLADVNEKNKELERLRSGGFDD